VENPIYLWTAKTRAEGGRSQVLVVRSPMSNRKLIDDEEAYIHTFSYVAVKMRLNNCKKNFVIFLYIPADNWGNIGIF